jgi:hypothetical protein
VIGSVSVDAYEGGPPETVVLRVTCCAGRHEASVDLTPEEAQRLAGELIEEARRAAK